MTRCWVLVLIALVACRDGGSKTKRTGSAAPVEMITQPEQPAGPTGSGGTVDEIEPNDGVDVATPVGLGATARGKIESETDADFYRLEVDKPGVLQVTLSGVDGMDLSLEVFDATGASLGTSERVGTRIKEGIPNAGVSAGTYALVVRQVPKKKPKRRKGRMTPDLGREEVEGPPPVYELVAQLVPLAKGAEREPNDDRGTANDLIVADNAVGFVGWRGDKDVWKLSVETLSDKNALDVVVSAVEAVALELQVTDAIGTVLATRKGARGQPVTLDSLLPVVPEGAAPFYYLVVSGDRSNPETSYTLHATARVLGPDPELEPNDNPEQPQVIAADRTVVHASWAPGDVDCFTVPPADVERTLEFTIDTPADLDLAGDLLVGGKVVATADKGKKGVLEKVSTLVPAGGTAVLRVRNPDKNASVSATYDVNVHESSATGDNAP